MHKSHLSAALGTSQVRSSLLALCLPVRTHAREEQGKRRAEQVFFFCSHSCRSVSNNDDDVTSPHLYMYVLHSVASAWHVSKAAGKLDFLFSRRLRKVGWVVHMLTPVYPMDGALAGRTDIKRRVRSSGDRGIA